VTGQRNKITRRLHDVEYVSRNNKFGIVTSNFNEVEYKSNSAAAPPLPLAESES
jgi:hypothetical protein